MRKHAASYEAHATAVAQWKADAAAGLERRNAVLEASVAAASDTVARRRRELEVLRERLHEADGLAPTAPVTIGRPGSKPSCASGQPGWRTPRMPAGRLPPMRRPCERP